MCSDISRFGCIIIYTLTPQPYKLTMAASSRATFTLKSCVRGYHVYKDIWDATIGEELECARESENPADRYAVAMKKDNETVGHVPRTMSRFCALFLEHNGGILCTVTGPRRRSVDLPQGGLEVPCTLTFSGDSSTVCKVKMILAAKKMHLPLKQALSEYDVKAKTILELPSKQSSQEDAVDDSMEVGADRTKQLHDWIKIDDVQLTEGDKLIVTEGAQLSDKHIDAAQKMLQAQHPNLKGMCSTLVAGRQRLPPSGLQAFFVLGNHWIVLSTLDCRSGEVSLYDSLYSDQDGDTMSAISQSLEVHRPPVIINLMKTGKQKGGNDCGLFAVGVLTALAFGVDVTKVKFDQEGMRPHFVKCIESKKMTLFPFSYVPSHDTMPANAIFKTFCL